jgi:hypothetical protein
MSRPRLPRKLIDSDTACDLMGFPLGNSKTSRYERRKKLHDPFYGLTPVIEGKTYSWFLDEVLKARGRKDAGAGVRFPKPSHLRTA